MLDLPDPPTAVFAGNNMVAVGVLSALRRRKRLRKIAVVGFDDLDLATVVDPPLTVIDHDPETIGRIAAGEVFGWLGGAVPTEGRRGAGAADRPRGPGEMPGPFSSLRMLA